MTPAWPQLHASDTVDTDTTGKGLALRAVRRRRDAQKGDEELLQISSSCTCAVRNKMTMALPISRIPAVDLCYTVLSCEINRILGNNHLPGRIMHDSSGSQRERWRIDHTSTCTVTLKPRYLVGPDGATAHASTHNLECTCIHQRALVTNLSVLSA